MHCLLLIPKGRPPLFFCFTLLDFRSWPRFFCVKILYWWLLKNRLKWTKWCTWNDNIKMFYNFFRYLSIEAWFWQFWHCGNNYWVRYIYTFSLPFSSFWGFRGHMEHPNFQLDWQLIWYLKRIECNQFSYHFTVPYIKRKEQKVPIIF